jgi:Na+-transporting NADH:ubiquinone oxidoreductase subunit C
MNKKVYSVGFMFLVAFFFTFLVSAVKLTNEDRIERNQQAKLQKTVIQVLGVQIEENSSAEGLYRLFEERVETIQLKDRVVYIGYERNTEEIIAYAFPVGGPGFWGPIQGMVAVAPDASKIIGLTFYEHNETPGLGARITESWFADQFSGLPLHPIEGDDQIFYLNPKRAGKAHNELDAITGASGTSDAVERFLNRDLNLFLRDFKGLIEERS